MSARDELETKDMSYNQATGRNHNADYELGSDWHAFVDTLAQDYYPKSISGFNFSDDDDDINSTILDLQNEDREDHDLSFEFDEKFSCSSDQILSKSCDKISQSVEIQSESPSNENSSTVSPASHAESTAHLEEETDAVRSSQESVPNSNGSSKKSKKKVNSSTNRTVTTETLFNGSIGDIVKTRKRATRILYEADSSHKSNSNSKSKSKSNSAGAAGATKGGNRSKNKSAKSLVSVEEKVIKNVKGLPKQSCFSDNSSAYKAAVSPAQKMDKQKKSNAQLSVHNKAPIEGSNLKHAVVAKNSAGEVAPAASSAKPPLSIQAASKSDKCTLDLLNDKKKLEMCMNVTVSMGKKRLISIEEYKAHRERRKKENMASENAKTDSDRLPPLISPTVPVPTTQGYAAQPIYSHSHNKIKVEEQELTKQYREHVPKAGSIFLLKMEEECSEPVNRMDIKPEADAAVLSPTAGYLPLEDFPPMIHSSRKHEEYLIENPSPNIPDDICMSESTQPHESHCDQVADKLPCDTVKTEKACSPPSVADSFPVQVPPANELEIKPSTSTNSDRSIFQSSSPAFPSSPSDNKSHRKYRRHTSVSSKDDSDYSSCEKYKYSKFSAQRKHSPSAYRRSRRSRSRTRRSRANSHRKSYSRSSSSSSSSSSEYKKRSRKNRSSSSSSSTSSSFSSGSYDGSYNSSKMHHQSSLSPDSRRSRHSKYHSKSYSSRKHRYPSRYSSRSSRRRHSRYSSSSRRKYSGSSTSNSHYCRDESSSRSRSRGRSSQKQYSSFKSSHSSRQQLSEEQRKQIDERRVVYVGLIPDNYSRAELKSRFETFGSIIDVRICRRTTSRPNDNYGFVTFKEKLDAYNAVEYGNNEPLEPKFDISFGGRKEFCAQGYYDYDKENEVKESYSFSFASKRDESFDSLLQAEFQRIQNQNRKH